MAELRRYEPTDAERKAIGEVRACIDEAMRWHRPFAQRVENRYSAWRGMREENAPKGWRSTVQQPLLINIVEGMLSSMEEAEPRFRVRPSILPSLPIEELVATAENAEIAQHLLGFQMRIDDFAMKQGPFMLQDLIAGFTPGKVRWLQDKRPHRYLDEQLEMVKDEAGGAIDLAMVLDGREKMVTFRDDPTFEPRDVRDFLYPESATSVETAPWIIDRTFVHYKTLERMEALGVLKNVEYLKETHADPQAKDERTNRSAMASTQRGADTVAEREQRLRSADRTRGLVEIVEMWTDDRVVTIGNRTVCLRDEPNPLWHGMKPFVVCSAIPDMFQIPGISVIEGLAAMQEMVWTLQNTRLDAARMLANPVQLIRGDVENADNFEWAPLAQWVVTHPDQVKLLQVDPALAEITMRHEALLKGDIQNVMGGLPYTGGAESQTIDQSTATGISIVTNIAQQILQRRKTHYMRTFSKIGKHFLCLDQQLLRDKRAVEILGEDGAKEFIEVGWQNLKGVFDVDLEMIGDSMMRQEARAESGALLTQAVQFAAPSAMAGVRLNLQAFWEKHLKAYGEPVPSKFFLPNPPPEAAPVGAPGAGTPPGAETLMEEFAGEGAGGITNESLAAGPTSPSSAVSMSPAAPMQRAMAQVGAGRSV